MIGAIAGDIIGSRFEGHPAPPSDFEMFHPHCRFTDDTVCSLAVAEALLSGADFAVTIRRFVRRYPDAGYGAMFIEWAFSEDMEAYGSWGNGAPMRVAAVDWLAKSEKEVDELATAQAVVSHNHPDAARASQAVARTIFKFRQGMSVNDVRTMIARDFNYDLRPETALRDGGFDVSAAGTVPPALAAAFEAKNWEEAVRTAVCLGGDTDTLACIAGAVAEAIHGVPQSFADKARGKLTLELRDILDRFMIQAGRP